MSWQNRLLTWALRRWVKPNSLRPQDVAASRALTQRMPFAARLAPGWRIRAGTGAARNGEWIEPIAPDDPARTRCILYFHGGAYISMSARTHRAITSRLAAGSNAVLFAPDYRLAPEHPFPAALEDAIAAYRAVIETGIPAGQIAVAGDSAGGGLALCLLLALRDAAMKLPAAAVLFSPSTDLAATGASIVDNSEADAMFFGPWIAAVTQHYLGGTPATNPLASPLYGDLTGLPPLLIQVGDTEVLLDDSRRLHEKARRAGVQSRLQLWPGVPHGWQIFASFLPEARAALRDAGTFLRAQLAASKTSS
jgi:acetyl esterase/lipase